MRLHTIVVLLSSFLPTAIPSPHHPPRTFPCPPGILSTPTYGTANAVFTVCSISYIRASAPSVYNILIDFAHYDLWNSYEIHVTPTSSPFPAINATMIFINARLSPGNTTTPSNGVIRILDQEHTTAAFDYDDRPTPGLLEAEHVSKVERLGEGWSKYTSWETFYGPRAVGLQATTQVLLQDAFEAQGEDLRVWVETGRRRGG